MTTVETVIILVNYNNAEDTLACIESINNTPKPLPLIIVVDNHSEEKDLLVDVQNNIPNVTLIFNDKNLGFGMANNVGIKWANQHVNYEFLLLLNNDTVIENNTLNELKRAFQTDSTIGIVTAKILYQNDKNKVWYGGGFINRSRGKAQILDFNRAATETGANKEREISFISGCTMMFTKSSIIDLGGFDDDFFMYCEDLELCLRANEKGYKLFYEPRAIVYHKVQGSINKDGNLSGLRAKNPNLNFLFYHMKSNQYLAMIKHLHGFELRRFKFIFWIEYFYICTRLFFGGRFDIFAISRETIQRIKKLKSTC